MGEVCFVNRKHLMQKNRCQEMDEPWFKPINNLWPFSYILIIMAGVEDKSVRDKR
jgi:hypothetical protein